MNVTPRKWYVVTTDSECVVTDANGKVLCTATAGEQKLFYATTPVVTLSDETATVGEANFKRAALALGLLGGGLPAWAEKLRGEIRSLLGGAKVELHFNKQKRHLLILTDLADDSKNEAVSGVVEQYAPIDVLFEVFNLNKYAECLTVEDVVAVNPDYKNDLTEDGEWIYPLENLLRTSIKGTSYQGLFSSSKIKKGVFKVPNVTELYYTFSACEELECVELFADKLQRMIAAFLNCYKLKEIVLHVPPIETLNASFRGAKGLEGITIDGSNIVTAESAFRDCTNFKTLNSSLSKLSDGYFMFTGARLDKESTLRILNSIPAWESGSHRLALGIHVDHRNDDEVLAAIALADIAQTPIEEGGKGWTMTIQWNGTPTAQSASTFGLRKPPIYAKLGEVELPDGTTENVLDWGHYVTNWEENGYIEFASVDEAEEYFNIKK